MEKLDLKKTMKEFYSPSAKAVAAVDVPELPFLMVDGRGNPNGSKEFEQALGALYNVAYTMKFDLKKQGGPEYSVMPLEGLWWTEEDGTFTLGSKDEWRWTAMIATPEFITEEQVQEAIEQAKKKGDNPALDLIRLERYNEGPSAQIMYVGPYSEEEPTIRRIHEFIEANGYERRGKHHEIYLGDPRRSAPEKLKTVIRQPVRRRD